MDSVLPPMVIAGSVAEDATQEVVQDVVRRGDGGRAFPTWWRWRPHASNATPLMSSRSYL
jgi:hypothetical protein